MPNNRWELLNRLLDQCYALSAEQRSRLYAEHQLTADEKAALERILVDSGSATLEGLTPPEVVREWSSAPAPPLFQPGRILAGSFTILDFAGRGGTSEVYKAHDPSGTIVAVKVFRPRVSAGSESLRRFQRESVIAAGLPSHPNICKVHASHVDTRGKSPVVFIAMEFLPGRTLAEHLATNGRFTPAAAEPLVRGILQGLNAAHTHGLIHRDLKPSNVMLVSGDDGGLRAVLTDFGLARLTSPEQVESTLTRSGQVLGTVPYMAPEQIEGKPADERTDIYGVGLIIFEMLTGVRARDTVDDPTLMMRTVPSPRRTGTRLPPVWEFVISECLQPDPRNRPRSAAAVLSMLGRSARRYRVPMYVQRRAFVGAGVLAGLGGSAWWYQSHSVSFPRGVKVIVADSADALLADELRKRLQQSQYISVLDGSLLADLGPGVGPSDQARRSTRAWREIALREGAPLVVFVRFQEGGIATEVQALGSDPVSTERTWSRFFPTESADRPFTALDEASRWVRDLAGESSGDLDKIAAGKAVTTTVSWQALRMYTRGDQLLAALRRSDALEQYRSAAERDPAFTAAWTRLGELHEAAGNERRAFQARRRAVECSRSRPLARDNDLGLRATLAGDAGDYSEAERLLATYTREFPDRADGPFLRALPLLYLGRIDEAITALQQAASFASHNHRATLQLAWAWAYKGDNARARALAGALREAKQHRHAAYADALVDYVEGSTAEALRHLSEAAADTNLIDPSLYDLQRVIVLADGEGSTEAAIAAALKAAQRAIDGHPARRAMQLVSASAMLLDQGDTRRARRLLDDVPSSMLGARYRAHTAALFARLGDIATARTLVDPDDSTLAYPNFRILTLRVEGEIALTQGRPDEALPVFRAAARLEPPAWGQEYLARALAACGMADEAAAEYRAYLRHQPLQFWRPNPEPAGSWRRAWKLTRP